MSEKYLPEGIKLNTLENSMAFSNLKNIEEAIKNETVLESRVLLCDKDYNMILKLGKYNAIIPKSEAAYSFEGESIRDIAILTRVSKAVSFVITDIDIKNGEPTLILSRKRAQEKCLKEYIDLLNEGDVIEARITHFENFGCFCDIGCGIIALLPIDCISVSRISHPKDRFYVGEYIFAAIKNRNVLSDGSLGRICLTHKELLGTWKENAEKFLIGETVSGIVRSVENYGIFVELSPNLAGLAEWKSGVEPGQSAAVFIKNIIPEKRKIKLVLVDVGFFDSHSIKLNYFITSGNVSDWDYNG